MQTMTADKRFNLLTEPLMQTNPHGHVTLPGLLALLVTDSVDDFPAMRHHQFAAWHMFLVQLAALALYGAGQDSLPETEAEWTILLRGLTQDFPEDEPWYLVVDDWTKPAFLQPPGPLKKAAETVIHTADGLDLLITARNHDVKQAIATSGEPQDWIFALVSLQTGEGYGGSSNYGIARMNAGSSSRPMLGLAPLSQTEVKDVFPRPGVWFFRDVSVLLLNRSVMVMNFNNLNYRPQGGVGLLWLESWPDDGSQIQFSSLDIWFIEICRRVRLVEKEGKLSAFKGNSQAARVNAGQQKGNTGDPWAPVSKKKNASLTLSDRNFDYRLITRLLSGEYSRPLLAYLSPHDSQYDTMCLVAAALSRGNSKTSGFKWRIIPITGRELTKFEDDNGLNILHEMAKQQIDTIDDFSKTLDNALSIYAAGGPLLRTKDDWKMIKNAHRKHSIKACEVFVHGVDAVFFDHLFARAEAQAKGAEALVKSIADFIKALYVLINPIFESSMPAIPIAKVHRMQARARAQRYFDGRIHKLFGDTLLVLDPDSPNEEEVEDDAS